MHSQQSFVSARHSQFGGLSLVLPHHRFLPDRDRQSSGDDERALLASIVQDSNDAIISKKLDGTITSWNQAAERLFGFSAVEAIGQHITLIIPADRLAEEDFIIQRLKDGERLEHFETVRLRRDGHRVDVSITVSPVRNRSGVIVGASKVARDISERKRYEHALAEMDRRKDEYLAILAHELRSPLSPLLNSAGLLRNSTRSAEEIGWVADVLERQVGQMARLIDDLLDIARLNAGKIVLDRQPVALAAVLERAIEENRQLIDRLGHKLNFVTPDDDVVVDGDADRLAQVFSNLVNNAAKYTNGGGNLWIVLERDADSAIVKVRDTGIGMSAEKLPHIFEMYIQSDEAVAHAHGGLGIGLTVVRRLVELHHGTISATSPGLGCGSEFLVRLPLKKDEEATSTEPIGQPLGVRAERPLKILIADDNRDSAATLALLLRVAGHEVVSVNDGVAALAAASSLLPDVALLDLRLPKLTGEEVAARLRADRGSDIVLIAVTGFGQEKDRQASKSAGFDHHLVKPVHWTDLESLLRKQH